MKVLVQGFRQADHAVFGDVVDAHVGRRQQACHTGCVDNVATVGGVFLGSLEHHRREEAHSVNDTPQIDAYDPFPIFDRVLPDQPTRAHPRVVEDEMGCAKALLYSSGQSFHLLGLGYIHSASQHLSTCCLHLCLRLVECVLLHIDQNQVHTEFGAYARTFQAKAGAGSGQDRCFAFEVLNHVDAFLRV